ncbi:MAG: hypothetical protein ABR612_09575 [Chromatocurvus sp.]
MCILKADPLGVVDVMFSSRFIASTALILILAVEAGAASETVTAAEAPTGSTMGMSAGNHWSRLVFQASNAVASAQAEISLTALDSDEFPDLAAQPESRLSPSAAGVLEVAVATEFQLPIVGKRHAYFSAWFDRGTAAVLQRVNERRGKRPKYKVTRFGRDGLYTRRANPDSSEERLEPPVDWSNRKENSVTYKNGRGVCDVVTDFVALLTVYSPAILADDTPPDICVVDNDELFLLSLKRSDVERLNTSFVAHVEGSRNQVEGSRDVLRVTVRGKPLLPGAVESPEFLGLSGDISLLFDASTRIPIKISGTVPILGRVSFDMAEVWIEKASDDVGVH